MSIRLDEIMVEYTDWFMNGQWCNLEKESHLSDLWNFFYKMHGLTKVSVL